VNSALLAIVVMAACPAQSPAPHAQGLASVAKVPSAEAMRLNAEGKQLYRQERWSEARSKYQAALDADPTLLAAQLNLACSLSRQDRYAEAAEQAASLIRKAFVPWSREIREAADLGILATQPEMATIERARAESAAAWGKALRDGELFVARTRPPVRVLGEGSLVLALNQEIFAWLPRTGRYLQVTSEDGRVLAFVQSADKRRVAYLLAGKLIRDKGQPALLHDVSLRVLDLSTMTLSTIVDLPGDARAFTLWFGAAPVVETQGPAGETRVRKLDEDRWVEGDRPSRGTRLPSVVLTSSGVAPMHLRAGPRDCPFSLGMKEDTTGIWRIEARPSKGKRIVLDTRYGAGLGGMPFPTAAAAAAGGPAARSSERNR
jgi:hypothetical protein